MFWGAKKIFKKILKIFQQPHSKVNGFYNFFFFLFLKKFEKVEKTGIISTKFSLRCTPSVILGFYHLHLMQLVSVDNSLFKKKVVFLPLKTFIKRPQKLPIIDPQFFFQCCQLSQNHPKSHFLCHKDVSLHNFYTNNDFVCFGRLIINVDGRNFVTSSYICTPLLWKTFTKVW